MPLWGKTGVGTGARQMGALHALARFETLPCRKAVNPFGYFSSDAAMSI